MTLVDRLVPEPLRRAEGEPLRRARLCVLFSLVLTSQTAMFLVDAILRGERALAAVVTVTTVTFALTPLLLRRTVAGCAHLLLVVTALNMVVVTTLLTDKAGQTLPWFTLVPVMATLLVGRRAGAVWVAISMGSIAAAALLLGARVGTRSADHQGELSLLSLTVAHYGTAWIFETTRERARAVVEEANREMRLVLDHVDQGLVTVDDQGHLSPQRSRVLTRWFGAPRGDDTLWSWIAGDERAARWLAFSWGALFDGVLPAELALDQLPSRILAQGRTLRLECRPLEIAAGATPRALVVLTDVTAQDKAEEAEVRQRELAAAIERASRDREGFAQFCAEATALVRSFDPASPGLLRAVHTLKGNCAIFGVHSVVARCHALESRAADSGEAPSADALRELARAWDDFADRVRVFSRVDEGRLVVSVDDYDTLREAAASGADHADLVAMLDAWRLERTAVTFGRFAEQARSLASRLERGELRVVTDDGAVRLDRVRWAPFWATFVHAVRNAVDHGIEPPEERARLGKTVAPTLRLTSRLTDEHVVVELADDGRGVDWARVAARAAARGLAHDTDDDLHEALFAEGLSTRDEVSETSGRGVGLAALRGACAALGGAVHLRSARGLGTTLTVTVPLRGAATGVRAHATTGGRRASQPQVPALARDLASPERRVTRA